LKVKQISVFLENRSGRLREVTDVLWKGNINIRALSLADTSDYGILRLIVDQPEAGLKALKQAGFMVSETHVIAVEVEDKPGGLARVLAIFEDEGINVEYMYAFVEKSSKNAVMIFRIENIDKGISFLEDRGLRILDTETVARI
jgi:hypothetical protein